MTIKEKVAYVQGLASGMELDVTTKEGKLLEALIDLVAEMADVVDEIDEDLACVEDIVDEIDEDLATLCDRQIRIVDGNIVAETRSKRASTLKTRSLKEGEKEDR